MKAALIYSYGGPEVLQYEDFPDPVPGAGEVLIKVAGASVNPVDGIQRSGGTADYFPLDFPAVIGWDISGTVVKVGEEVSGFKTGDRVMAWAFHTYAELCVVKVSLLSHVPRELDLAEAAALPLATITGAGLIAASSAKKGQTVLVSGAVGSVARAAVCAAQEAGLIVIAGVQAKQVEEARQLGVSQVVALDDPAAFEALVPVDVVANTVRGATAEALLRKVKPGGIFASVTGVPDNSKDYPNVKCVAFVSKQDPKALDAMAAAVVAGRLRIPISQRFPLKKANEAHVLLAKGSSGKILLIP